MLDSYNNAYYVPVEGVVCGFIISIGGLEPPFMLFAVVLEGLMMDISEGVGDNDISIEAPG